MKTIQINTCTQEELEWLPGVGPATAKKIIEARPIKAKTQLEQLVPPSAWLKMQKAEVEFSFGTGGEESPTEEARREELTAILEGRERQITKAEVAELKELWKKAPPLTGLDLSYQPPEPALVLQEPQPMILRRVMPGQELRPGAEYLCIWNMRWGPDGVAWRPADAPIEAEIETWFRGHGMGIQFAHYGPSVRMTTRNAGLMPLVLFEIIKETEEAQDADETEGNRQGHGQGD